MKNCSGHKINDTSWKYRNKKFSRSIFLKLITWRIWAEIAGPIFDSIGWLGCWKFKHFKKLDNVNLRIKQQLSQSRSYGVHLSQIISQALGKEQTYLSYVSSLLASFSGYVHGLFCQFCIVCDKTIFCSSFLECEATEITLS